MSDYKDYSSHAYVARLEQEVDRLRTAIRAHRDQRGDDRCWLDDYTLYAALGEPVPPHACLLNDPAAMLECCERFIASRHDPARPYLSPQREIDRLTAEVARLAAENGRLRHPLGGDAP